jgi:hypothetical protein
MKQAPTVERMKINCLNVKGPTILVSISVNFGTGNRGITLFY